MYCINWKVVVSKIPLHRIHVSSHGNENWYLCSALFTVSHKFGYGLMDAGDMVSLAEQWTIVPSQHICKSQEINEER